MALPSANVSVEVRKLESGNIIEIIENGKMKRVFSCCNTDCTILTMWFIPNYCPYCGKKITDFEKDWGK